MARTDLWTREQTILAFNLYFKIPYGTIHGGNPKIRELAAITGRSLGSVGRKLQNLASLDPVHKARGIMGLSHHSKLDEEVFNEFVNNWEALALESEHILAEKQQTTLEEKFKSDDEIWWNIKGESVTRLVNVRVRQSFFREIILNNFDSRCVITGINILPMLRASHIIPWAKNEQERMNPENGLCLSALYDSAYDKGFIGVTPNYKVILSEKLKKQRKEPFFQEHFGKIEGIQIRQRSKFFPRKEFLEYHLDQIFDK